MEIFASGYLVCLVLMDETMVIKRQLCNVNIRADRFPMTYGYPFIRKLIKFIPKRF